MTRPSSLPEIIHYWEAKAEESLAAAHDELQAGRLTFAVNRLYYACFYLVSALLLQQNLKFKKHSGVRAVFHQHLVKTGKISREMGKFYDELFEARQRGDYFEMVFFEPPEVEEWLEKAKLFVAELKELVINCVN